MEKPLLYLSEFLEKNRQTYYDNLTRVREKNDLLHWIKFFLVAIETTADRSIKTLQAILKLRDNLSHKKIPKLGRRSVNAQIVLNHLLLLSHQLPSEKYQHCILHIYFVYMGLPFKNSLIQNVVSHQNCYL